MAFGWMKPLFKGAADGLQRLRFNSWTLGGRGAEIFEKSAEDLELERMNPLRGVDEWRLGQIFDDARDGIYADLAWLYNEIEGVEPALVACCDMREGAAGECGWLVTTPDAERARGFDATLAGEQRAALLEEFGPLDDDLADLAEHLVSAFFRGAAHALPLWNADGSLAGFRRLDLWNFAFDRGSGLWWWNADASRDEGSFQPIPPGELVTLAVSSSRHVDHAALPIFIRSALGTKRYGVWLDRFGIPPVAVIMPPSAERGEQANYMDLARKFARGGNGILPNGSAVSYGTEARAVCPFPDFIRFQQEQIYTVGIGRVQSGANDSANLGGNAAGVVEAGFARLVRRDARRIARAINDTVTRKVLARLFPGRPALAQFAWDTEARRTSREVLEDAGLARNAGLAIDRAQLEEMTGYTLSEAPQAPDGGFGGAPFPQDRRNGIAKPLQNARTGSDGEMPPPAGETRQSARESISRLAEALGADMAPARDALLALLDLPEAERPAAARELMGRLDELLPADPAMAAVLAEEMAEAFAEGAGEGTTEHTEDTEALANARGGNPDNRGQFSKTEGPHGRPREPETPPRHDRYGETDEKELAADPQKNFKRGANALEAMARKRGGYIDKAMYREESGWIRFDWGTKGDPTPDEKGTTFKHGHGISHILAKHKKDAAKLPEVIAHGKAVVDPDDASKTFFVTDTSYAIVIPLDQKGRRILTMFEPKPDDKKLAAIKKYPPAPKRQGR